MALGYSEELHEWLSEANEMRLVASYEGRGAASVNAFIDAAKGRARTLTFVETKNGGSVCGGYLDVPWTDSGYVADPGRRSFIFTLKNHIGMPPTKFAQKRSEMAAYMRRDRDISFGHCEGFMVWRDGTSLNSGESYEAPAAGVAIFHGDDDGSFRADRWELWEVG
jgi:hypothetical protein